MIGRVKCPGCKTQWIYTDAKPDKGGAYHYETRGLFARRRYQQAIAPPMNQRPPTPIPVPFISSAGPLGPGETAYRTLSQQDDVKPQWDIAWRIGVLATVAAGLVGALAGKPDLKIVWIPCLVGDLVILLVFVLLNWDVIKRDSDRLVTRTRAAEGQAVNEEPPEWNVKAEVQDGKRTLYDEHKMKKPEAWHKFCKAVVNGRNFSETESGRHKVHPHDWTAVFNDWVGRSWVIPAEERGTPTLEREGRIMVGAFARTPPP